MSFRKGKLNLKKINFENLRKDSSSSSFPPLTPLTRVDEHSNTYSSIQSSLNSKNSSEVYPKLFVGGLLDASPGNLDANGITHVLSVAKECDSNPGDNYVFKYIPLIDDDDPNMKNIFEEAFEFIDMGRKNGKVLVHCFMGVSRSVTVTIAYMIRKYRLKCETKGIMPDGSPSSHPFYTRALYKVQARREEALPNIFFCMILYDFDKKEMDILKENLIKKHENEIVNSDSSSGTI